MPQLAINPALRQRRLDLIHRGKAGDVQSEPGPLAVLYHLTAVVLGPDSDAGEAATGLAAWYDGEVEAKPLDYGDGDSDAEEEFENVSA